jgi:hypothetical protein
VGDIDGAYAFGKLSLAVLERQQAVEYEARTRFISSAHLGHWKDPVRQRLDSFRDIYQRALDTGDLEFAAWALMIRSMHHFFVGTPLPQAVREAGTYAEALVELRHDSGTQYINAVRQAEQCLMGEAPAPWRLQGASLDDVAMLPVHHQANDLFGVCNVHLYSLVLCYWFSHHEEGHAHAIEAEKYLETVAALLQVPVFYFSTRSTACARREESGRRLCASAKSRLEPEKDEELGGARAEEPPQRFLLVEAERARIAGRPDARPLYGGRRRPLARTSTPRGGLVHEPRPASGRRATSRDGGGLPSQGAELYVRWGAAAKVAALDLGCVPCWRRRPTRSRARPRPTP